MNGAGSRRKGSGAERELAGCLHDLLGVRLRRNLSQARGGGFDLELEEGASGPIAEGLALLAIECKRYATITPASLAAWWSQACRQAEAAGKWPALCYRGDRAAWRCRLPLSAVRGDLFSIAWEDADLALDMGLAGLAALIREGGISPRKV